MSHVVGLVRGSSSVGALACTSFVVNETGMKAFLKGSVTRRMNVKLSDLKYFNVGMNEFLRYRQPTLFWMRAYSLKNGPFCSKP